MGRRLEHKKPAASPHPAGRAEARWTAYAVTAGGPDPDETESTGGA
ncbi:hypothetical protein [Streptomyces paradoxus]|uniref:Uncharacterized protein n=1 Tax=Streptomyces paradoxus TaxID=66375 RepID=A0A7W9WL81_9ACTN|nr:hypothetical protein [Streptomyces paradoxus]MBB6080345.1 hypothetical protein [Streptomyces paradoxus]